MKINIILIVGVAFLFAACGGRQQQNQQNEAEPPVAENEGPSVPAGSSETQIEHPGKDVYKAVCLACHMADGSGVPGMHPPLSGTDWVTGDKERLIEIVLNGMSGEIEVKGETYNSIMPPNSHLSDRQIADVLTYIRTNFGNDAGKITPQEVAKVREEQ
ncbi:MAG: c-type cytochrome [Prolixibacteraceae bacterium]